MGEIMREKEGENSGDDDLIALRTRIGSKACTPSETGYQRNPNGDNGDNGCDI
jgi:hypothetical protein